VNRKISVLTSLLLSAGFLVACQQEAEQATATGQATTVQQPNIPAAAAPPTAMANGLATGTVAETVATGGYTYVLVDVGEEQLWAAGPPMPMAVGDAITFSTLMPMKDFHSKAMNRDFPVLYFVDGFSMLNSATASSEPEPGSAQGTADDAPAAPMALATLAPIEKVTGGYTIAEILAQRNELTGKPIKVRGRVTKVVNGVMGKNWIHISDSSGDNDFIVTTSSTASVTQIIVAEGALSLNRDFGYGYKYDILMEDAALTLE
jgi:hypothetical protein